MAYITLTSSDREISRLRLDKSPVVVGRAPDCDVCVHDIVLSRRHCRLTPTTDGWLVIDLDSRNGTWVAGRRIEQRRLKDGDIVMLGKTCLTFRNAAFVPAPQATPRPAAPAPADPNETLSGTVFALEYSEPVPPVLNRSSKMPTPKPRPRDPDSFETDDVYSMLEQIASSSWDSIYAVNAQPLRRDRELPRPRIASASNGSQVVHAGPKISIALQVTAPTVVRVESPVSTVSGSARLYPSSLTALFKRRIAKSTRWVTRVGRLRLF